MTTHGVRYAEGMKVLPVLAPADITTSATNTEFVDMSQLQWLNFCVQFGSMTSDSTDTVTITVQCSTAATSGSETEINFNYRESAAVASDSMGAISTGSTAGVAFTATDIDNKCVWIDIDPARAQNTKADGRWCRVVLTPTADVGALLVGAVAYGEHRYPGNSMNSAT